MDRKLGAWARAVKARRRTTMPPLWLFTDPVRVPQLEEAIAALPRGLCGVVFRHDDVPGRAGLLRRINRLCRERRLLLVVAGNARDLPPGAGRHLRGGFGPRGPRGPRRFGGLCTSSAHGPADLVRARRNRADLAFLSPVFATSSHPGAASLGPTRWAAMARASGMTVLALGGVDGANAARLPRWAGGAGAIGSLVP